ncbi:PQQ-dependent catabolism-associated beta-propeller protein [Methyloceanibacter sp.]|uniref:PQQ-dependent catabolism-associated beta-propeller protein n=1 Tax=Methyloceanibacter sp. TaxID=1965321 RepID=UPI003D6D3FBF
MRRAILVLLALVLVALAWTPEALAEKRVALVIGNGAYANATQLPNPRNDAEDVAAALRREGFDTIVGVDLDQAKMQDTAIAFARAAREADVALFYYSGHAMQFGGVNYLMPVDAKLSDEADLRRMARVDDILADLQQAKNLRILVLDACRDNPFADQLKRSIGLTRAASAQRGLARIDTPQGMIVAFSTQAQRTADDGTGRNSPYTAAFLKHIEEQEEIGRVFRRISTDVYEATQHRQLPELSLSMIGEYYLRGEGGTPSPNTAAPTPSPLPAPSDPARDAWDATQNTDSIPVLEAFIAKFGDSFYASLAKAKLATLRQQANLAPVPATPNANPVVKMPGPGLVFVTNEKDNSVTAIDAATLESRKTIPVGKGPRGITSFPDGKEIFVALEGGVVAVIDTAQLKVTRKLESGADPTLIAVDPKRDRLIVTNSDDSLVTIVDQQTGQVLAEVPVGVEPEGLAVSPDSRITVATSMSTSMAHIIDNETLKLIANVLVDSRPREVVFSPDGTSFWVSSSVGGSVSVVDAQSYRVTKKIEFAPPGVAPATIQPTGMRFSADGTLAFVALGAANRVAVVDAKSYGIVKYIAAGKGPERIDISNDGTKLFVANKLGGSVTVIDVATLDPAGTVRVGRAPWGVAATP